MEADHNSLFTRKYFGPVTIKKLHFQLLDPFGRILTLNNMDLGDLLVLIGIIGMLAGTITVTINKDDKEIWSTEELKETFEVSYSTSTFSISNSNINDETTSELYRDNDSGSEICAREYEECVRSYYGN